MNNSLPRFDILSVSINAINLHQTVEDVIDDWIRNKNKDYIVLTGTHGIIEMQKDEELRMINNNSGLTTPDGMPVVWIGRMKGYKHIEKVYAPTIMIETFQIGVKRGYRHFFYGGKNGVADMLAEKMLNRFPGIQVVGIYCPPFRALTNNEKASIIDCINVAKPDIVWVGLGCPKQERWMAEFRPLLEAPVLIGVGAGFDFLSGEKPFAPKWIQNSGFEWLYRLLNDPQYLWRRYARVIPLFIFLNIIELLGFRYRNNLQRG